MAMRRPGVYVPLSAHYADDERIMEAGEDAELLYLRMLAYAARTPLTEGWISDAVVRSRLGILPRETEDGSGIVPGTDAGSRAGRLREVGLIEHDRGGWRIVSWLRWNRSADETSRERARDKHRKTALARSDTGSDAGNDAGNDAGTSVGNDAGVPHAFRLTDTDTDKNKEHCASEDAQRFDEFWSRYPKKVSKKRARERWRSAIKKTDPDVILAGLDRYVAFLSQPDQWQKPKDPDGWLSGEKWADELPATESATTGQPPAYWTAPPPPDDWEGDLGEWNRKCWSERRAS